MDEERNAWADLPYHGFLRSELEKKRPDWERFAGEICAHIERSNIGFVADTSAGKTIIAILVSEKRRRENPRAKTLFVMPTKDLCSQHRDLFLKVTGHAQDKATVITGEIAQENRVWQSDAFITFATGHVAQVDMKRRTLHIADFDLLVIDELHHTRGKYPYAHIAPLAYMKGVHILGLTASPEESPRKIKRIKKKACLHRWISGYDIQTPEKIESVILAPLTAELKTIERNLRQVMEDALAELHALGVAENLVMPQERILKEKEFKKIEAEIAGIQDLKSRSQAITYCMACKKLRHALYMALSHSYVRFLEYAEDLKVQAQGGSKSSSWLTKQAAKWLLEQLAFSECVAVATEAKDRHPKVVKFTETATSIANMKKTAVAFVGHQATGRYLCGLLKTRGVKAETLFGGRKSKAAERQATLLRLANKEIDIVIATSVIREGVSVPEIDWVISYTPLQKTIDRIQQDGRTGRMRPGHLLFIILDHPVERIPHFSVKNSAKKMKEFFREGDFEPAPKPVPPPDQDRQVLF